MLKWLFNCTPAYAALVKKQDVKGVVLGKPQGEDAGGFIGYYIETDQIERCAADMEPTVKDESNVDL